MSEPFKMPKTKQPRKKTAPKTTRQGRRWPSATFLMRLSCLFGLMMTCWIKIGDQMGPGCSWIFMDFGLIQTGRRNSLNPHPKDGCDWRSPRWRWEVANPSRFYRSQSRPWKREYRESPTHWWPHRNPFGKSSELQQTSQPFLVVSEPREF